METKIHRIVRDPYLLGIRFGFQCHSSSRHVAEKKKEEEEYSNPSLEIPLTQRFIRNSVLQVQRNTHKTSFVKHGNPRSDLLPISQKNKNGNSSSSFPFFFFSLKRKRGGDVLGGRKTRKGRTWACREAIGTWRPFGFSRWNGSSTTVRWSDLFSLLEGRDSEKS